LQAVRPAAAAANVTAIDTLRSDRHRRNVSPIGTKTALY